MDARAAVEDDLFERDVFGEAGAVEEDEGLARHARRARVARGVRRLGDCDLVRTDADYEAFWICRV